MNDRQRDRAFRRGWGDRYKETEGWISLVYNYLSKGGETPKIPKHNFGSNPYPRPGKGKTHDTHWYWWRQGYRAHLADQEGTLACILAQRWYMENYKQLGFDHPKDPLHDYLGVKENPYKSGVGEANSLWDYWATGWNQSLDDDGYTDEEWSYWSRPSYETTNYHPLLIGPSPLSALEVEYADWERDEVVIHCLREIHAFRMDALGILADRVEELQMGPWKRMRWIWEVLQTRLSLWRELDEGEDSIREGTAQCDVSFEMGKARERVGKLTLREFPAGYALEEIWEKNKDWVSLHPCFGSRFPYAKGPLSNFLSVSKLKRQSKRREALRLGFAELFEGISGHQLRR